MAKFLFRRLCIILVPATRFSFSVAFYATIEEKTDNRGGAVSCLGRNISTAHWKLHSSLTILPPLHAVYHAVPISPLYLLPIYPSQTPPSKIPHSAYHCLRYPKSL
ncbi:hypothetical protein K440DRAFT_272871 [Wilcoxina mikolae CBS 423.85]|nr:hypothetical protein K440DRAFT_272871 [Wilcoxina mikolae CBS 423.85]